MIPACAGIHEFRLLSNLTFTLYLLLCKFLSYIYIG
ncbi:hypothetical protein AAKU67_003147 [Oxalobacteraceae bacterium GrIS 2.11]